MERAHPIVNVPELDTSKPFTIVPSESVSSPDEPGYDCVVVVGHITNAGCCKAAGANLVNAIDAQSKIDISLFQPGASLILHQGKRIILSPTGPLNRCEDDVRRFSEAAEKGIKRSIQCGSKTPLLVVFPDASMPKSLLVTILGAFNALYTTLELREAEPTKAFKANKLGVWSSCGGQAAALKTGVIIEESKTVTRDLQGSDPERMNPENFTKYCEQLFQKDDTNVFISTISGAHMLEAEYPCMAAVDRACKHIDRHRGRVIWLNYSNGKPERTIVLVGKGLTYDTGGADIKAGGVMAGMHRDKGGASAVAGFMHAINLLKPKNVQICAGLAVCRNSVGSEAYLADEIIKARSGKRVRVGNTDAEGRMAMVDLLCFAKERCLSEKWVDPEFYTIATLTGHAKLAYGKYSGIVANGPYNRAKLDRKLQESGEEIGDQFDVGSLRREDFEYHVGKDEQSDILQAGNNPSTRTPRGHQGPAAFLIMTSGLRDHGLGTEKPIKYAHLDIGGSAGPFPGIPTAAPLSALLNHYFL